MKMEWKEIDGCVVLMSVYANEPLEELVIDKTPCGKEIHLIERGALWSVDFKRLVLGDSIRKVGDGLLAVGKPEEIHIGAKVRSCEFILQARSRFRLTISKGNHSMKVENGNLLKKGKRGEHLLYLASGDIPANIESIGRSSMLLYKKDSIVIPASVKHIEYGAFRRMKSLKTVLFEHTTKLEGLVDGVNVSSYAFENAGVETIDFGNRFVHAQTVAFLGCELRHLSIMRGRISGHLASYRVLPLEKLELVPENVHIAEGTMKSFPAALRRLVKSGRGNQKISYVGKNRTWSEEMYW